jgi:hypothetical protein
VNADFCHRVVRTGLPKVFRAGETDLYLENSVTFSHLKIVYKKKR